ncbi:MAG: RdgB/HAM1 family non-canonical purine NTP pyrophosphatase [Mariprofundaceae bacterium]
MQLVIASNNQKKRAEITAILVDLDIEIVPADETVFIDVIEDGKTFAENARKKAEAFARANSKAALADDSGLCVDALHGAPGIYSSRFAGEHASDNDNNVKLLSKLAGKENRQAHFICSLHLSLSGRADITAEGQVNGVIMHELSGCKGFGYDPLFFSPELGKAFADATAEEKASVSHRGRALRALKAQF